MSIQESKMFDERKYSPLESRRRKELRGLAKEYGLDVDLEGKKEDMLPILEQAHKRGVFKAPPVPIKPKEYDVQHLGVAFSWCVLDGDKIVRKGYKSKEEAQGSIG
jgi:hypothetical protein